MPLDSATIVGEDESIKPEAGDYSVCINCGTWLRFTDATGGMRLVDPDDLLDMPDDVHAMLTKARAAVKLVQRPAAPRRPARPLTVHILWPKKP
jgi:hypothetical protein